MASRRNLIMGVPSYRDRLECTFECRAANHANVSLCAAYLGNIKLLQHCSTLCANPFEIQDNVGRNALHVAASCGHLQLVHWLVARMRVKINVPDLESKWTALHRSMYYGQLGVAALLLKHGASINVVDNDGWSPLALLNDNRKTIMDSLTVDSMSVHLWGRNPNITLGHDRTKEHPERLDLHLPHGVYVIKILLCKFHSVFLTDNGHVLTCGHGLGGRLGHDSEQSIVVPRCVGAMEDQFVVGVAAARNHTVILTKSGAVYTCGINDTHQLGLGFNPASAPPNCLAPKLVKALKSRHVIAVGAGRFHTAMCTEAELYTSGRNLGQLGYTKTYDTQVLPHLVTGVNLEDGDIIRAMSASDSATAVLTKMHHVFVCTDFIVRHIRFGFLEKMRCLQFEVCASLSDKDHLRKVETEPTKVLLLDSEHKLWLWLPMRKGSSSSPHILSGFARCDVVQFSLGRSLTVVTKEGEVFRGSGSITHLLNLQRVPHIQNARAVFTDFKADNFAYIQYIYRSPFLPVPSPSTLASDLSSLLEESCFPRRISDILLKVGDKTFTAHKFFLVSQTHDFSSQLLSSDEAPSNSASSSAQTAATSSTYRLNHLCNNPAVFDAFLHYLYGSHICLVPLYNHRGDGIDPGNITTSTSQGDSVGSGVTLLESAEVITDSSIASVDNSDLTEEYDKFTCKDPLDDLEDAESSVVIGKIPPKRKSSPHPVHRASNKLAIPACTSMKVLPLHHRREELQTLLLLANTFGLSDLKKRLVELLSSSLLRVSQVIPRSPLELKKQAEFSDITLVSKEGKSIQCHKCVLVARSEYFRCMLLMGWKESLEGITTLSLPVDHRALKALIDFIYTDEFKVPTLNGNDMIDWVMSVLVIADQLLLSRLKELCELSLTKSLDLRNVVEFLEFSDTYSAQQLKKSCLQFLCVNASCFFEGRYLDSISIPLLEVLSQSYRALIPSLTKHVIRFSEPDAKKLPESYFLDDRLEEDVIHSGASDEDEECLLTHVHSGLGADALIDTSAHSMSAICETLSPYPISNSRRRRKRKSSHSELKTKPESSSSSRVSQSLPSPTLRINPSSPNPASPVNNTHPCSPVEAAAHSTPDCSIPSCTNPAPPAVNSTRSLDSTHAWKSVETRRTPRSVRYPVSNNKTPCEVRLSDSRSVPSVNLPNGEKHGFKLPLSIPSKPLERAKTKDTKVHTCLLNKFNGMAKDPMTGWTNGGVNINSTTCPRKELNASPAAISKGAWAVVCNSVPPDECKSLRDIMAKEEVIQSRQLSQISPSSGTSSRCYNISASHGGTSGRSSRLSTPKSPMSESIPVSTKNKQVENSLSPSGSPTSSNPWKTSESSPTISMRDLLAEAEAEEKQNRILASMSKDKIVMKVLENTKSTKITSPHQQVSFASIIKSQEKSEKRSKLTAKKAFPLIQIEERAISELRSAYSAVDNPDEYIVVERCGSNSPYQMAMAWKANSTPRHCVD